MGLEWGGVVGMLSATGCFSVWLGCEVAASVAPCPTSGFCFLLLGGAGLAPMALARVTPQLPVPVFTILGLTEFPQPRILLLPHWPPDLLLLGFRNRAPRVPEILPHGWSSCSSLYSCFLISEMGRVPRTAPLGLGEAEDRCCKGRVPD